MEAEVGKMEVQGTLVLTDPCYSKAMDEFLTINDMQPGTYRCIVGYCEIGEYQLNQYIRLILDDAEKDMESVVRRFENPYDSFSTVIVCDSGSAGFFNGDKPDFDSGEWESLCAWMQEQENTRRAEGELRGFHIRKFDNGTTGFWGYTGGDFDLAVNMARLNDGSNRVAAIEIQFPNI